MNDYRYDPDTWSPILAGLVAGAVGAVAASLISLPLTSPDENVANTASITFLALVIGAVSGLLWRRLRASRNALRTYRIGVTLALFGALTALAITNLFVGDNVYTYTVPVAFVVFLSVGLLTPAFDTLAIPRWIGWAGVAAAVIVGISGLFA